MFNSKNKVIKNFQEINAGIDDDYQKLYDAMKTYKRSYKRACKLLMNVAQYLECADSTNEESIDLVDLIRFELNRSVL